MRSCEIREGTYRQRCTGDGYQSASCTKPEIIKGKTPEECQKQFIKERFYSQGTTSTLFSNCAHKKYPPKRPRDFEWLHKHIDYDGTSYSHPNADGFSLTK